MRRLASLLVLASALLVGNAAAQVAGGYQEAVFSVSNASAYEALLHDAAGWETLHRGKVDREILDAWGLSRNASASEIVVANPGSERGFVRLVQFSGVEQQQIRSSAQSWDTGGWFDVNTRVVSMDDSFAALQAKDFQAATDPVQFGFGPFVVREWLARGPDGIVFALIERVEPPLEGWPHMKKMSRLFNATQIVPDIEEAREFYLDKLGFETYLDHTGPSQQAGPNVLGLPHNLATEITRHVSIVHPQGVNEGSVELLQFEGATGEDFSSRAVAPNLGILTLRFPVNDMQVFVSHLEAKGIDITMPVTSVNMAPYGELQILAIRGPGGVWLEFYSN